MGKNARIASLETAVDVVAGSTSASAVPVVNVKWPQFGAKGDGSTDDSAAIQAALAAAGQDSSVFLPRGTYRVDAPINITGRRLLGERHGLSLSSGGTVIRAGSSMPAVVYSQSGPASAENLIIDANELADYGVHLYRSGGPVTWVRNVAAQKGLVAGLFFDECQVMGADRITAYHNAGHGIVARDCNASRFTFVQSRENAGHGLAALGSVASGGVSFVHANVENNALGPVLVQGTRATVLLQNVWSENSTQADGIVIDDAKIVNVISCRITGFSNGTHRAFRLTNGSNNCMLIGNCAAPGDEHESFAAIEIEDGCENNRAFGNFRVSDIVTWPLAVNHTGRNWADRRAVCHLSAVPSSGTWARGDMVFHADPSAGGPMGWMCVTGGTPGTWKAMPNLES